MALEAWESLPVKAREWIVKIAVTLVIAVAWHWYNNDSYFQRSSTRRPLSTARTVNNSGKESSRLVLDHLPQDLILEEKIEGRQEEKVTRQEHADNNVETARAPVEEDASEDDIYESAVAEGEQDEEDDNVSEQQQHDRRPTRAPTLGERQAANTHVLRPRTARDPTAPRPVFRNRSRDHPGMEAFWYWCDVECSLFRIYSLGRKDGTAVHPPYIPRSRSGRVRVSLRCRNRTENTIHVYWINYKGKDEFKGKIVPGGSWNQLTWIEHPWVFRDSSTDETLLYYIPDRIIPTCEQQPTVEEDDPETGVHRFDFVRAPPESPFWIHIDDPVLPFPAKDHFHSPEQAVDWTLLHMHRMDYADWDVLVRYLSNILHEPGNPKYRQIRIENPTFHFAVWQTPAKGLLLAMGFVEQGIHIELGTVKRLPNEQTKQLSSLLFSISVWRKRKEMPAEQPAGADGYGRAGFGRAGAIS